MEKQPLRGILIGNPTDKILFYKNVFDNKFAVIKLFFYPKKNTKNNLFSIFVISLRIKIRPNVKHKHL